MKGTKMKLSAAATALGIVRRSPLRRGTGHAGAPSMTLTLAGVARSATDQKVPSASRRFGSRWSCGVPPRGERRSQGKAREAWICLCEDPAQDGSVQGVDEGLCPP